jgi:CubicO group peptidase (beta-lactamase class C family)
MRRAPIVTLCTLLLIAVPAAKPAISNEAARGEPASGQAAGTDAFARIDDLVNEAMAAKATPGAVVVVGRGDQTLYEKAFGFRATVPAAEPMTLDTIFDVASLTKVVATTTAVMTLLEEGRLRLNDTIASHIPGFERYGKGGITIRHLLTHVSGLRPDVDLHPWTGYDAAIELAKDEVPTAAPGETFVYSDINFFLLGDIVKRVTGQSLDAYLKARVFTPLGMSETGFNPARSLLPRIAPTERCAAAARRGSRSNRAPDGRHRGSCGAFQHRTRSEGVCAHAARQGPARNDARDV